MLASDFLKAAEQFQSRSAAATARVKVKGLGGRALVCLL